MEKTLKDFVPIEEGVNDPAIFKAVFLAGGPGSGKSFIVGKTALTAFGYKVVNSDNAFEMALKKAGMEMTADNIFSVKGQSLRDRATNLTKQRKQSYINGRLGLVIDGTGKDYEKIKKQKIELEKLGYETAMIFVNTDLETAVSRDAKRDRTLGAKNITPMWQAVQKNIGRFQNLFRQNMFIVDNSDGSDYENAILGTYRKVGAWSRSPVRNRFALAWIKDQKQRRNITRESVDEACWVGWKQKGMKKKGNRIVPNCVKEDDLEEKIKDMEMGDVIKDFYKSDAPQFRGKSKKKRREMYAAKLQSQETFKKI